MPPGPFHLSVEVGAAHPTAGGRSWGLPSATQQISAWPVTAVCNSQRCRQKTSTSSCNLPTDALHRVQIHSPATLPGASPGHGCAPSPVPPPWQLEHVWGPQPACTQPGTGSPGLWPHVGFAAWKLCLRGEEQEVVTLRQVTPFLTAFLCHQSPCGQEVGFPETLAGELITAGRERLDSHHPEEVSPPTQGSPLPSGLQNSSKSPPDWGPSDAMVYRSQWAMAAGEEQEAGNHL